MRGRWPRGPEGASADGFQDSPDRRLRRREDVPRWNAKRDDAPTFQPRVTLCIPVRSIIEAMPFAVDLDGQTYSLAVEIENVTTDWMLSAEV
jgi:hypothetical protein